MSEATSLLVQEGARRFLLAELEGFFAASEVPTATDPAGGVADRSASPGPEVDIAAIGTTAERAVKGALLPEAISRERLQLRSAVAYSTPDELFAASAWRLGVVLSPWKQEIGVRCGGLSPSAETTGVVDTVLRTPSGVIGFNTNTWAAMSALDAVTGDQAPGRLLLLGTGASARSVALAVSRAFASCEVVIAARSTSAGEALADQIGARLFTEVDRLQLGDAPCDVVVNTTTWGETEASESEPFGIDLDGVLAPGVRLFDLNNRVSALQQQALAAGCVVVGGGVMQRVTNAARAALLARFANA
jgi:shikimate dehydrogenase